MKDNFYYNKNVLITGGTKGIGLSTVMKFIDLGSNVIYTYTKDDKFFNQLIKISKKEGVNLYGIRHDSLNFSKYNMLLNKVKKRFNKIDFLINNVGSPIKRSKFINSNYDLWLKTMNLNLFSTVTAINLFYKMMIKSNCPTIINVSSIAAKTGGGGDSLHYSVSKSAINTLTFGLAKELNNFRILSVAPSAIDTQFQKKFSSSKRIKKIIDSTPLNRMGNPDEVASLICMLCNKDIAYLSGETIYLSGGR